MVLPGLTLGKSLPLCDPHSLLCRVTLMTVSKGNGEVQSDDLGAQCIPAAEERGSIGSDALYCGPWGPEDTPHCIGPGVTHCFPGPVPDGLDVHQAWPGYVSGVRAPQGPQAYCVQMGWQDPGDPTWRSLLAHTPSAPTEEGNCPLALHVSLRS